MAFTQKLPVWLATGVEPPEILKNEGWKAGMKPPDVYFNYLQNKAYLALKELQEKAAEAAALTGKVDKEIGKGLSTNDYTTVEKTKLSGIANGANNYTHPATHQPSIIVQDANNRFVSDAEKKQWNTAVTKAAVGLGNVDNVKQLPLFPSRVMSVNLNNYKESGVFAMGGLLTNAPSGFAYGNLFVTNSEQDRVTQLLHDPGQGKIFIRYWTTSWSSWSELETTSGSQAKASAAEKNAKDYADNINVSIPIASSSVLGGVKVGRDLEISLGTMSVDRSFISGGLNSIALGKESVAGGDYSVTIGYQARASRTVDTKAVAIGGWTSCSNNSTAIGYQANAGSIQATAVGANATAINTSTGYLGVAPATGGTDKWYVPGSFTVNGTKNFEMPHPAPHKKDTHIIRHAAVESPTAGDTLYRFKIEATKDGETVTMQLPDYFQYLNKDVDVWVNGEGHFGRAFGSVKGDILSVTCELAGTYKCLVIGTRNDDHDSVQSWDLKGVEREVGESWTGETYVFEDDEVIVENEYLEEEVA